MKTLLLLLIAIPRSFVFSITPMKKFMILLTLLGCLITGQANAQLIIYYLDADGDGYGNPAISIEDTSPPPGYVENSDDCNDSVWWIHPGGAEYCNGIDDNCNGLIDGIDPALDPSSGWNYHPDADLDGFGDQNITIVACPNGAPPGYILNAIDCDDNDPDVHPYAPEIPCNGVDDNCNGVIDDEVCNGVDDDCDGLVDDNDPGRTGGSIFYVDGDLDGFGHPFAPTILACAAPPGYVNNNIDCDDNDPDVYPGAPEISCNGVDNNCDGIIDPDICNNIDDDCDGEIDEDVIWQPDFDQDGYVNGGISISACTPPGLGWYQGGPTEECDTWFYATISCFGEICNGIDDDGNGLIDEEDPGLGGALPWFEDADGDGSGNVDHRIFSCSQPEGYAPWPNYLDCDDTDPTVTQGVIYYQDIDGDGYGNPGAPFSTPGIGEAGWNEYWDDGGFWYAWYTWYPWYWGPFPSCDPIPGYVPNNLDCDDSDPESCILIDTDCDGVTDDFDICPHGDDSVDNNGDNIPDCSQLLNYNDYSPDWHCGNNKIYVCHNDNNPHTICIDANSLLPAHYDHGDNIGPCTSCTQNLVIPGSNGGFALMAGQELELFPNPANEEVTFHLHGFGDETVELTLHDYSGKIIWQQTIEEQRELSLDLSGSRFVSGIYFVKASSAGKMVMGRLEIVR